MVSEINGVSERKPLGTGWKCVVTRCDIAEVSVDMRFYDGL